MNADPDVNADYDVILDEVQTSDFLRIAVGSLNIPTYKNNPPPLFWPKSTPGDYYLGEKFKLNLHYLRMLPRVSAFLF